MTKEEFDTIKVGDILTNKIKVAGGVESGYDYVVTQKASDSMKVSVIMYSKDDGFLINREGIESCLDLRKK